MHTLGNSGSELNVTVSC